MTTAAQIHHALSWSADERGTLSAVADEFVFIIDASKSGFRASASLRSGRKTTELAYAVNRTAGAAKAWCERYRIAASAGFVADLHRVSAVRPAVVEEKSLFSSGLVMRLLASARAVLGRPSLSCRVRAAVTH